MSGAGGGADRRTSTRVNTHQHVVFSDHRAMGPLRTGTAVDRSTGGLRIVTAFPEPVGSTIQIELQHSGGGAGVTLLEGRVMHVVPAENGLHAMGIRLAAKQLRPPAPTKVAGGSAGPARATTRRLDVTVGEPGDGGGVGAATLESEPVKFRRVNDRSRAGSWAALLAILALVVILVLLVLEALKEQRRSAARIEGAGGAAGRRGMIDAMDEMDFGGTAMAAVSGSAPVRDVSWERRLADEPITATYASVRVAADGGVELATANAQAAVEFGGISIDTPTRPQITADRFAGMLEYASGAHARGETGLALATVRRALNQSGGISPAWRDLGEEMLESFRSGARDRSGVGMSAELALDRGTTVDSRPGKSGVRIDVDSSALLMRVWRDDAILAEFPIGLGRDGATPTGTFRIANKVSDPAWYPADGRVVPAGDPGNPIGARWMGLASGGAPNGIGIHPTAQAASIGQNASQGCVRMRPSDAETLYRLAPIGTPVRIHE